LELLGLLVKDGICTGASSEVHFLRQEDKEKTTQVKEWRASARSDGFKGSSGRFLPVNVKGKGEGVTGGGGVTAKSKKWLRNTTLGGG